MGRHRDGGRGQPEEPDRQDEWADQEVTAWRRLRRESAHVEWTTDDSASTMAFQSELGEGLGGGEEQEQPPGPFSEDQTADRLVWSSPPSETETGPISFEGQAEMATDQFAAYREETFGEGISGENASGEGAPGATGFGEAAFGQSAFGQAAMGETIFGPSGPAGGGAFGREVFGDDPFRQDPFREEVSGEDEIAVAGTPSQGGVRGWLAAQWADGSRKKIIVASAAAIGVFGASFGTIHLLSGDSCPAGSDCARIAAQKNQPLIPAASPEETDDSLPEDDPADDPSEDVDEDSGESPGPPLRSNRPAPRPDPSRSEPKPSKSPSKSPSKKPGNPPSPDPSSDPDPTKSPEPSPSPSVSETGRSGIRSADLAYAVTKRRPAVYGATITIVNTSADELSSWTIRVPVRGKVASAYGADWSQRDRTLSLNGKALAPGAARKVRFTALGSSSTPQECTLDGGRCTIEG